MSHELVAFPNGSYSVKPVSSPRGHEEAMHSHIGPWQEAQLIYVGQARLAERLGEPGPAFVLFDVGMGIAANALAALECFLESHPERDLQIISFEKHLDGLRLALEHAERFPWVARYRTTLARLLDHRHWSMRVGQFEVRWELREGDFLEERLERLPSPDLVFFDFYSPKANPELWSARCFAKLRAAASAQTQLFTYCASTAARSAMLLAGFYAGTGRPTGAKSETTAAAARLEDLARPLGPEWLEKLKRSDKPLPPDWDPGLSEEAFDRIRSNPQFATK